MSNENLVTEELQKTTVLINEGEDESTSDRAKPKRKKKTKMWIAAIVAMAILITAVVTPIAFILSRPTVKLVRAFDKTMFKSQSVAVEAEIGADGIPYVDIEYEIEYGKGIYDTEAVLKTTYLSEYSNRVSLKDGVLKRDGVKTDLDDVLDEIEHELYDNGIDLDVADILDSVINKKLDRNELLKACIEDIFPAVQGYNTHGFLVNTSEYDYAEFAKGFWLYLEKEGVNDLWTCEKTKTIKNKDGKAYKYCFELSEFLAHLCEYALDNDEFDEFLDEYCAIYWDRPGDKFYISVGATLYTSPKDMKSRLIKELDKKAYQIESENLTLEGRFVISMGRLTYFEYELGGLYGEIQIESKR